MTVRPGDAALAGDPAFPIEWEDPTDPDLTWEWDDMHMPTVLSPLAGDYVRLMGRGFAYGYRRLGLTAEVRARIWNGYAYFARQTDPPGLDLATVFAGYSDAARAEIPRTDAYWRGQAIPEIRAIYGWLAGRPVETMPLADLAELWDQAWARIGRCWSIHFYVIRGPYQAMEDLADLYESIVPDAAPGEALSLIGGGVHELQEVERRIEILAGLAAAEPGIAARLAEPGVTLASIAELPGADTFMTALMSFLVEHGHLGQNHDDLALASWAEAPELLLAELAKRLRYPPAVDAETRRVRLATDADLLAEGVRTRLADDPGRLAEFEGLLAATRRIGPMTETHNYWIDRMAQASLRRFVMRVARRLAEAEVIATLMDVWSLRRDEVPTHLRAPSDQRGIVAARQAEQARWATVRPPRVVGTASAPGEPDRFDGVRIVSDRVDEVRGTGASAGIVRGPARLTLGQADFEAVGPGDIIICPSSNPSWVPLFAIAGGLVTDTGGVLSHAAVVAREFALPAVVGTGDATSRIADGRLVEIDGTTGIVRLL